jgi:hypothetical protein
MSSPLAAVAVNVLHVICFSLNHPANAIDVKNTGRSANSEITIVPKHKQGNSKLLF